MANDIRLWRDLSRQLRADSIRSTTSAGSGHPSSSLSAADLLAVLLTAHLRYDFTRPGHPNNDHFILSKGHAAPLLYAAYKATGAISDAELLSLRRRGSRLEGHPTPRLPWVDAATGSLGQGLAIGAGIALAAKRIDHLDFRTWVLLGDSETAEGSVWEAVALAAHYRLDNLVAILDVNRLGQRGETMAGWHTERYRARFEAFGWDAIVVDGHDHVGIDDALRRARCSPRPAAVIARTIKGRGVSFIADQPGWHGRALTPDECERALRELAPPPVALRVTPAPPDDAAPAHGPAQRPFDLPWWAPGSRVATRQAYGEALKALGSARRDVVALDAEVSNSTGAEVFKSAFPDRFIEMFIAEQAMVGFSQGMAVRGAITFASTFAAFFCRAFDQIRMAAVSQSDLRLVGSHAGVSICEDGPSQMALEDLALFRSIHGSTVLYPSDATSCARLVEAMAACHGVVYLRTTRAKTPLLYDPHEDFPIGGSKLVRHADDERATIVAAGITVHEALTAADELLGEGVAVSVLDCYSIKPIDVAALRRAADASGHLVVVEDHWPQGGLGEGVLSALAEEGGAMPRITHLAVRGLPGSATPAEQLDDAGISAVHIAAAVRALIPIPT